MASKLSKIASSNDILAQIAAQEVTSSTVSRVPLGLIRVDPNQPRKLRVANVAQGTGNDDPSVPNVRLADAQRLVEQEGAASDDSASLVRLALNILQDGVRTPITVSPADDQTYRLVTGERRVTAALLAYNWTLHEKESLESYKLRPGYDYSSIPAVVEDAQGAERFRIQVAENLLREDMTPEDMGRAWKRMLEESMFPNVYAIARHFGIDETTIQGHIDLVDMAVEAAELGSMGVVSQEVIGRLLSDLRGARKRNKPAALYDAFVRIWKERTQIDANGKPIYPSQRQVLDAARAVKSEPTQPAPVAEPTPAPTPAQTPVVVMDDGVMDGEDVASIDHFADEMQIVEQAEHSENDSEPLPANVSESDFKATGTGANTPRAPRAPALDRPHRLEKLNVPAFDLSERSAKKILEALGLSVDGEVTGQLFAEALAGLDG